MLFDARAHEPLLTAAWRPAEVAAEIRAIARDADAGLRDRDWWPWHPLDAEPGDPEVVHGVYRGASGVLWALHRLVEAGLYEPGHDYARLAESLELMWGSPGLLPIADAMLERTGEQRWAAAWSALAEDVMRRRGERVPGVWTQRPSGSEEEYLGPAHGMAGVAAALARRPELLAPDRLLAPTKAALAATAIRDGDRVNWPPSFREPLAKPDGSIRTQWCHGAPGIVASLASLPRDGELDALLLAGGELTWAAGPLRKGPGLCHGTAGNGFALLKLFARTADESWLARARRFAMHAAAQVAASRSEYGRGRYTLWTGDLGTAIYLQQCLSARAEMPGIDTW